MTAETITLYRPVGPKELALIEQSDWREFPPRLPEQPIFYPVLNESYAVQIARDWNVKSDGSGFVTRFRVAAAVANRYPAQVVGNSTHRELWVPAEDLPEFNRAIFGPIEVITEFRTNALATSAETKALEHFYSSVNRNDLEAITRDFDPQIVRTEPEGFKTAGTHRGIAEVQACVTRGRGTWAEGTCEPEKYLVDGDKIVVYLHAWVRTKDATEWMGGRFADGFVFRNGKIVEYHTFWERADALKWAGITDES